jgi:glutamate synthase (NADPH/NADH) small chain
LIEQFGIQHDDGVVTLEGDSYRTSNEKIFACGDVIFGKGQGEAMVVSAAQQGKKTAYEIDSILMGGAVDIA